MFFNEENKTEEIVEENKTEEIKVEETKSEELVEENKTEETKVDETVVEAPIETKNDSSPTKSKNTPDTSSVIAEEFLPDNFNPFARPVNPRFANRPANEFEERVLQIKRVIKVTKGGRRFKFSALVVVGDRKGRVGYAIGKHIEVPEAIKKAIKQAKRNLYNVKIVGEAATIPHEIIGHQGAARVMLKPAVEGKGIIASDIVRAVVELAGYRNIYSKNLGTNNPTNIIFATVDALQQMRTGDEILALRKDMKSRKHISPMKKEDKE